MKITATIITFNEQENIEAAIESLRPIVDDIVVVDSESTDETVEIARRLNARVFIRPWEGYSKQKNFAAEQANFDWIFSLDADERVSPELADEILQLKTESDIKYTCFEMPRRTFYLGSWIRYSGWYPDYKSRLHRKDKAEWTGEFVHESLLTEGAIARLEHSILHYTVRNASDHHLRIDRYTTLAAKERFERGKRASFLSIGVSPLLVFIKTFILKLGFLDGIPGLAIAWFAAHYVFLRQLKLWEMRRDTVTR